MTLAYHSDFIVKRSGGLMTQRGRKRKAGDRHPSGQLVQKIEPNPVVIAQRLAVLGGHSTHHHAESPMSVALARAYITEDQHKAGETIARLYRATHPQRRMIIALHDYDPADRDPTPIANMPHADIATAFEAILAKTQAPGSEESRQIEARKRYNALCLTLRPIAQIEIFNAFCMNICPLWLSWRIAGRLQSTDSRYRWQALRDGLTQLAGALGRKSAY